MTIDERFWDFHTKHPEVYTEIVKLCRQWHRRGRSRWAIDGVFQVIRWQRRIAGLPDADEMWKLNDHYRACYARLVMALEEDLDGIFEIRARTSVRKVVAGRLSSGVLEESVRGSEARPVRGVQ